MIGLLIGVRVVAYAPTSAVGWLFLVLGMTGAVGVLAAGVVVGPLAPGAAWVGSWTWWASYCVVLLLLIALLGAVDNRSNRLLLVVAATGAAVSTAALATAAWPDPQLFWESPEASSLDAPRTTALLLGAAVLVLCALVAGVSAAVRAYGAGAGHRGTSTARATGWLVTCTASLLVANVLEAAGHPWVWVAGAAALPVSAALVIVRHGLFDIDLLVHRSVLYAGLSVALLTAYAAAVAVLSAVAPSAAAPAAAAATALAAHPLHAVLQRRVDRYIYGDRSAPLAVLTRLSDSVRPAQDFGNSLQAIAACAGTALRLPWAAVTVPVESQIFAHGHSRGLPRRSFALTHRGQVIGALEVEARSPEEDLTPADVHLLELLASQAGATVHAVLLSQDLQRARERLVLAREEERRRLRRDLHDGLGPCLSGVRLSVAALSRGSDPGSREALDSLGRDLSRSNDELRALIDDLRPPLLDRGLQAALQHHADRLSTGTTSVRVAGAGTADGDAGGGAYLGDPDAIDLPAAVEVAAYRIATEAMHNAVRHARASSCRVDVRVSPAALELTVDDDGTAPWTPVPEAASGGSGARGGGIGLAAMNERAAELGGTVHVDVRPGSGTEVRVRLPLSSPGPVERTSSTTNAADDPGRMP